MRRPIFVSACTLLFFVSICIAQQPATTAVPNLIRYSGSLKDAQGAPLASSTAGVTFAIYGQQEGGAPIWMETQNVTTDSSGNYSVLLGSTTATGLPSDLFSEQEQRWLGVQVQGESEQPRVLMVSVPYAFKAHEAETLGGKSVSDFVLANGANSSAAAGNRSQAGSALANNPEPATGGTKGAASQGPTNFSGSTANQIVGVTQSGTGAGISASVASASGTAGVFNNTAGGKIISGQNNGTEKFSVDGSGNVKGNSLISTVATGTAPLQVTSTTQVSNLNASLLGGNPASSFALADNVVNSFNRRKGAVVPAAGDYSFSLLNGKLASSQFSGTYSNAVAMSNAGNSFTGSFGGNGAGLTGLQFSQLGGTLASAQLTGTYSQPLALSNTANEYYGNGFDIDGDGRIGGDLRVDGDAAIDDLQVDGDAGIGGTLEADIVRAPNHYEGYDGGIVLVGNTRFVQVGYNQPYASFPPILNADFTDCYDDCAGVVIDVYTGQLGYVYDDSSKVIGAQQRHRQKQNVQDMGIASGNLFQLRPVTFSYRPQANENNQQHDDGPPTLQYGLIPEEVAKVYPELVAYDKDGQPYTVRYQYLTPMLLNEVQKQYRRAEAQAEVIRAQEEKINELEQRLSRLENLVESQPRTVASK